MVTFCPFFIPTKVKYISDHPFCAYFLVRISYHELSGDYKELLVNK